MRTVLVTGAGGFIGRHCLARLQRYAQEIHVLGRSAVDAAGVRSHRVNLFTLDQVAELVARVRPSHLLHLAWIMTHGIYWNSAENLQWVEATLHLVRQFTTHGGRRVVVAGSCAEYEWKESCCSEKTTPLRPATLYGTCKNALGTLLAEYAQQTGISLVWPRLFFLYGPHEDKRRLVASVIRSLLLGEEARCSTGNQLRDFLHVDDAAGALVALLGSDVCGPINVGSGQAVAVREVVHKIAAKLGRTNLLRLGALPPRRDEPACLVADISRLRQDLLWQLRYSLDTGLDDTIAWWQRELQYSKSA
jgi:nucleoside-diphosphate-sugar epimerase